MFQNRSVAGLVDVAEENAFTARDDRSGFWGSASKCATDQGEVVVGSGF